MTELGPPFDTECLSDSAFWALAATLTAKEVRAAFDTTCEQTWSWRNALVRRLGDIADSDPDVTAIVNSICDSLESDDQRAPRLRSRADASLRHLLQLLPPKEQARRGLTYLSSPRASRRQLGLKVLRVAGDVGIVDRLMRFAALNKDLDALFTAVSLGARVGEPDWALEIAGDDYIAARILQTILDQEDIARFSAAYPRALVWAIGRARSKSHSGIVREILASLLRNPPQDIQHFSRWRDRVGIAFWTLGRLGLREDILHFSTLENAARQALAEQGHGFAQL